jgi:hypothetical protein
VILPSPDREAIFRIILHTTVRQLADGKVPGKAGKPEDLPDVIYHSALSGERPGM